MIVLNDLTFEKLQTEFEKLGLKKYRAEQVFRWTANGATSFDELTNISKDLKEELSKEFYFRSVTIEKRYQSQLDSTRKFLMKMDDGELVESVLMEYKHGFSVCISTQVGCLMGCKFCASTINGKKRDLTPSEMLGQIIEIQKSENIKISNIVLMGMGEPLDNYENVIDFVKIVNHHMGLNIGIRHIAISTCGIVDKIQKLADENLGIALSISLHGTTDEQRDSLMPVNKKWNIEELINACREYNKKTRRRIHFEYILINKFNDNLEDAKRLAELLKGITEHVNLIPVNSITPQVNNRQFFLYQKSLMHRCRACLTPVKLRPSALPNEFLIRKNLPLIHLRSDIGKDFVPSTKERTLQFRDWLMKMGVNTTIRRTLGSDISASCGQLKGSEN